MKKWISVFLAALLLVSCAVPAVANTPMLAGDLDGTGEITTADARLALRAAVGLDLLAGIWLRVADVNGNGSVGTDDARTILRMAIGLERPRMLNVQHTEHVWDSGVVTVAPGCETAGEKTFTCTVCGETRTEPIPAKGGHQWNAGEITVSPSCETQGAKVFTCTVCGDQRLETLPAAGHTWEPGQVVLLPTWLSEGSQTYRCAVCGRERLFPIPALGENKEDDRAARLLAFMKAHGTTDGGVTVYKFTDMDVPFELSYDESAPENGFLFKATVTVEEKEFGQKVTYANIMTLTLLPPFTSYTGTFDCKRNGLYYLRSSIRIADPANLKNDFKLTGLEITVTSNSFHLSMSEISNSAGEGTQWILYALEKQLKANEADFSVRSDLGFVHVDEWNPEA